MYRLIDGIRCAIKRAHPDCTHRITVTSHQCFTEISLTSGCTAKLGHYHLVCVHCRLNKQRCEEWLEAQESGV